MDKCGGRSASAPASNWTVTVSYLGPQTDSSDCSFRGFPQSPVNAGRLAQIRPRPLPNHYSLINLFSDATQPELWRRSHHHKQIINKYGAWVRDEGRISRCQAFLCHCICCRVRERHEPTLTQLATCEHQQHLWLLHLVCVWQNDGLLYTAPTRNAFVCITSLSQFLKHCNLIPPCCHMAPQLITAE
jgi:hypothetical protein